jgi:hypothetical protein
VTRQVNALHLRYVAYTQLGPLAATLVKCRALMLALNDRQADSVRIPLRVGLRRRWPRSKNLRF